MPVVSNLILKAYVDCCAQDFREEQRAKRQRLLSAAASACIRRGMIRYLQVSFLLWLIFCHLMYKHSMAVSWQTAR